MLVTCAGSTQILEHARFVYQVEFINAAIWLLSRQCVERVGLFNPVFSQYGEDREYADRVRLHGMRIGVVPNRYGFHMRTQEVNYFELSVGKFMQQEKAIIRYRLSRHSPGLFFNILSALTRAIFARLPGQNSYQADLKVRITLLFELFLRQHLLQLKQKDL